MFRDVVAVLTCAAVTYLWLSGIVSPIAGSVRSLIRHREDRTAWGAVALATGGGILWTVILACALITAMAVDAGDAGWRGVTLGNVVWACELVAFARVPRLGPTFETATALGIVAFVREDPWTLSRVERLYRTHALGIAPGTARLSAAVRGAAA